MGCIVLRRLTLLERAALWSFVDSCGCSATLQRGAELRKVRHFSREYYASLLLVKEIIDFRFAERITIAGLLWRDETQARFPRVFRAHKYTHPTS